MVSGNNVDTEHSTAALGVQAELERAVAFPGHLIDFGCPDNDQTPGEILASDTAIVIFDGLNNIAETLRVGDQPVTALYALLNARELRIGQLASATGVDPSAVKEEIKDLVFAGLVQANEDGARTTYSLVLPPQS